MSENVSAKNENQNEPSFKLNYTTVILALVILIPLVYTVVTNLQPPAPAPVITPAAGNTAATQTAPASNAVETALRAVVDNPGFDSYTNLGIAYYGAGKFDDAVKAFQKTIEYNPKSELAYNNIAAAYGAAQNWDEEIKACQKALAINPNFDLAKRNLAWAMGKKTGK